MNLRIGGAVSDLHAADAQYHKDCMAKCRSHRNIRATLSAEQYKSAIDEPFKMIADDFHHESSRIWNSVEVPDVSLSYNGVSLSRRQSIIDRFGEDILVLSGKGVASILVFKNKAAGHFKIVSNDNDDDVDIARRRVANTIVTKSK